MVKTCEELRKRKKVELRTTECGYEVAEGMTRPSVPERRTGAWVDRGRSGVWKEKVLGEMGKRHSAARMTCGMVDTTVGIVKHQQ